MNKTVKLKDVYIVFFQVFKVDGFMNIMTVHILEMDIEPDAWGQLIIQNGEHESDRILATIPIINGTLPQSVSTTYNSVRINFQWRKPNRCPTLADCVKFTIMVDAGPSKLMYLFVNFVIIVVIIMWTKK